MVYKVPSRNELAQAIKLVLAQHGQVPSQRRLGELVRAELARQDAALRVSDTRVRRIALEDRLATLTVVTGTTDRPAPDACPVCGAALTLVKNRTLSGGQTVVATRCPSCPYRSGPSREVPLRYGFRARSSAARREQEQTDLTARP